MFITENYSSKFKIVYFWDPHPKSPAENGIPKKLLDTSLEVQKDKTESSGFSGDLGQL